MLMGIDDYSSDKGITRTFTRVGSPATLAAIGTNPSVGSIPCVGVALKDMVIAVPHVALPDGVFVSGFRVSGADNVNFSAGNTDDAVTGSLVGAGWSVLVTRAL